MSRAFHPDFFHTKTDTEQTISLGNSALLNNAYRTLKDPIQRAEYLVGLEAGSVKDIRSAPPADLFEEILSLQEDLESYREGLEEGPSEKLADLRAKLDSDRRSLEDRQRELESSLFALFGKWDALHQREGDGNAGMRAEKDAVLKEMREVLSNRTYVRNIVTDVANTLESN